MMGDGDGFVGDHSVMTGTGPISFSQLLLGGEDMMITTNSINDNVGCGVGLNLIDQQQQQTSRSNTFLLDHHHHNPYSFTSSSSTTATLSTLLPGPKMLCFGGGGYQNDAEFLFTQPPKPPPSPVVTRTINDSSSSVSSLTLAPQVSKTSRKRNAPASDGVEMVQCTSPMTIAPVSNKRTGKKVRKEKLGNRVQILQQLVSPFGKTDTASVLHEAMGYIRFLHDQIQVLCSPYLNHQDSGGEGESKKDLRSRGLCLVPVSSTVHVDNTNGADFWSPAMKHSNLSSSSSGQQ